MKNIEYSPLNFMFIFKFIGAIIIATIFHCIFNIENENLAIYTFLKNNGRIFVEMFFIMSGMLFYYVYYPKIRNDNYTKNFFIKRAIAFYPLILFVNIYAFTIGLIVYHCQGVKIYNLNPFNFIICCIFGDLSAIEGPKLSGSMWYLNVLMLVYVLAVILTLLQRKKERKWMFFIPIFIGVIMYILYKNKLSFVFWNTGIPRGLIAFFTGVYLMMFLKHFDSYSDKKKIYFRIAFTLIFIASTCLLFSNKIYAELTKYNIDLTLYFALTVFPSLFALCYDVKWLNQICSITLFKYLSSISVAIYVLNGLIHKTIIAIPPFYNWCESIGGYFILLDICFHIIISIGFMFPYNKIKVILENKFIKKIS